MVDSINEFTVHISEEHLKNLYNHWWNFSFKTVGALTLGRSLVFQLRKQEEYVSSTLMK